MHELQIYRGSYMSVHVLLNLLNELGKRDKMRGLSSILSLFRKEFNKFNNTWARMLDSIYHMTLRLLWNLISAVKALKFCHYVRNVVMDGNKLFKAQVSIYEQNVLLNFMNGSANLVESINNSGTGVSWPKKDVINILSLVCSPQLKGV